jgi:hypothetical protein
MDAVPARGLMKEVSDTFFLLGMVAVTLGAYLGMAFLVVQAFK